MNIFSRFRLSKYAYDTVRMPITSLQYLYSVVNFSTNFSPDFEQQKHGPYSKSPSFCAESDKFGNLKEFLDKKEKLSPRRTTKLSENESKKIVKIYKKDESNVFGNLSETSPVWYPDMYEPSKQDNDVSDDSVIVKNISKKFRCPKEYFNEMKRLVNEKKVKEALDLFVDMRRNFVTPLHSHFTYMIGVCGRIGYTEMAFKLLRQMTDRRLQPTPATLTGLFNACGESPFPEYGLKKARLLKEKIETKGWIVNLITYRAMVKAFGRCGDIATAFQIVDEMAKGGYQIDVETYSFLLMSCVANKESGFTYAVEVWRKMRARRCSPNVFTFNLLLRAARDCGAGPDEISRLLLQHWTSHPTRPYGFPTPARLTTGPTDQIESSSALVGGGRPEGAVARPTAATSLLTTRPDSGPEILELVDVKTPADRLKLLGGLEGFLQMMSSLKVKPDIKTFTLLLHCLPDDLGEEEKLLSRIDSSRTKPDVDFFNILIRRRNFRKDAKAARDVLVLLNKYELAPNIMTFGVLALGCRNRRQAETFISEMEKLGCSPNVEIAGCLLSNACATLDFDFARYALQLLERRRILCNERVLLLIERTLADVRKNVLWTEQGKSVDAFYRRDNLREDLEAFRRDYDAWLKRIRFEPDLHPWAQYSTRVVEKKDNAAELWKTTNIFILFL